MPVGKAARRIITARLATVRSALSAVGQWGPDTEPVHHLRVATRRASAALDVFADLLPGRTFRKARKVLETTPGCCRGRSRCRRFPRRRADLGGPSISGQGPGLHFLLGDVFAERQARRQIVLAVVSRWEAGIVDRLDEVPEKVRSGKRDSLGDWGTPVLAGLLDDLAAAAGADLDDYANLHRVRIVGKRLRYALELFIDCFPPDSRTGLSPRRSGARRARSSERQLSGDWTAGSIARNPGRHAARLARPDSQRHRGIANTPSPAGPRTAIRLQQLVAVLAVVTSRGAFTRGQLPGQTGGGAGGGGSTGPLVGGAVTGGAKVGNAGAIGTAACTNGGAGLTISSKSATGCVEQPAANSGSSVNKRRIPTPSPCEPRCIPSFVGAAKANSAVN